VEPSTWVGELHHPADFVEASALYAATFGYADRNLSLNPLLLTALVDNGGVAVGARTADGALVAFAYGFRGQDGDRAYLYSQAAFVAREVQRRGLGRRLKEAQRRAALDRGLTTMRWAYDPLLSGNAHFNLTTLGARGIAYRPDFYGSPGSDRMIVEWALLAERPRVGEDLLDEAARAELAGRPAGTTVDRRDLLLVAVPREPPPARAAAERRRLGAALAPALAHGYLAVGCVPVGERTAAYALRRDGAEPGREGTGRDGAEPGRQGTVVA